MLPSEAAKIIGCTVAYCRALIRVGKLKATSKTFQGQKYYDITKREAERFRDAPVADLRGWPRGVSRPKYVPEPVPKLKPRKKRVTRKPK